MKSHLLSSDERFELLDTLRSLGLRLVFVSETGSKAWGTDTENSDHDFTVVAHDTDYDIYRYPRESFSQKIVFKGHECDVRVFSVAKFLRKLQKSVLVGYEAINSPYVYFGSGRTLDTFQRISQACFDPREMYRSVMGSLSAVKSDNEQKRPRQQFRYMFVALQLLDYQYERGPKPLVNFPAYTGLSLVGTSEYNTIGRLYQWATSEQPTEQETAYAEFIRQMLFDHDYPKLITHMHTQDEHREFLNDAFRDIMSTTV